MLKVLTAEQVSEILGVSVASLDRYRSNGTGPNYIKIGDGGLIRYLENDVIAYLEGCRQLPTESQKMQAAMQEGSTARRAANAQRRQELQQIDREDRESIDGVTPLVMGFAGQAPGMVRCDPMTGKPIGAQTIVTDLATGGRADTTVAMSPVQHGAVPVPWQK